MFRDVLVHIPSERQIRPVVDAAVSLTMDDGFHLDAIAIGYETAGDAVLVEGSGVGAVAIMNLQHDQAIERADAAISVFETEARLAGIAYTGRTVAAIPSDAEKMIGGLARLYDLTIVLQPDYSLSTFDNSIPQTVLFESGGPMLMVPYIHKGPLETSHVGIAWDRSRLAARALRDAMPFLTTAKTVTLISVNEDRDSGGEVSSHHAAAHLSRRGVTVRREQLSSDRDNIHGTILSVAAESGIGLMAVGGYGHSRFHERIFGGVTRGMFESLTVPILLSH